MSPHKYLMRVRVTQTEDALKRDAAVKIEALALELGWTSKAGSYCVGSGVRGGCAVGAAQHSPRQYRL
jgi:hypothetical protein